MKHPRLQSSRCWERPGEEVTFSVWEGTGDVSPHGSIASTVSSGKGLPATTAVLSHWELGLPPTTSTEIQEQRNTQAIQVQMLETANSVSQTAPHQYKNKGSSSTEITFLKSCKWN